MYAELGSTWFLMLRRPVEAAHVLGKLLLAVGPDRIVWGTDSIWYGSPQPLIDAFRALRDPRAHAGGVRLPGAHRRRRRRRSSASNARSVYGITDDDVARAHPPTGTRDWVAELQPTIAAAITRAGRP